MGERVRPGGPRGLDRVRPPDPRRPRSSDVRGKRALYSVDPDANPTPVVLLSCRRCEVERGLTIAEVPPLLRPPFLVNPFCRSIWTRCPSCDRRAWIDVERGPGIPWPF